MATTISAARETYKRLQPQQTRTTRNAHKRRVENTRCLQLQLEQGQYEKQAEEGLTEQEEREEHVEEPGGYAVVGQRARRSMWCEWHPIVQMVQDEREQKGKTTKEQEETQQEQLQKEERRQKKKKLERSEDEEHED